MWGNLTLTAVGLKWLTVWGVLLLFGLVFGPSPGQAAVIALAVALLSWGADRLVPFKIQGITRWALDGGLAGLTIYVTQFLWPGPGISLFLALFAGFVIGAIEIPLHFFLASRFGLRRRDDNRDGVR
ncbi:MAG TPA: hypothetical protein VD902_05985 [Symbiobacteriaceae bacterium]|nr:hypothetical protein [Symbiobacteriaceae bacterium]